MANAATILLAAFGAVWLAGLLGFGVTSLREREPRAARVAFGLAWLGAAPLLAAALLPAEGRLAAALAVLLAGLAGLGAWLWPVGRGTPPSGAPSGRVDERDTMFARARLRPGTPEYLAYYEMRPERKAGDDDTRSLPGLLSEAASLAEPTLFAVAKTFFGRTEALRDEVDGPVAEERHAWPPKEASETLRALAQRAGAVDAGVTELRPYHVYTHVGRGSGAYGEPVDLPHSHALAFTVEMSHAAMRHAPLAPVVVESARQYVEAARIGIELAQAIRSRGYRARAHIDGNYRVIAPLVARDAGLGQIGRMGLVMTPRHGPRVRLGVVTTDLPLAPHRPADDRSVLHFCSICRKCAAVCPAGAIPAGERVPDGESGRRWVLDPDACFRLWSRLGTDCGRCMAACPYSHPDNAAHKLVRWAVKRSGAARHALLKLDDLFYGRKPQPLPLEKGHTCTFRG